MSSLENKKTFKDSLEVGKRLTVSGGSVVTIINDGNTTVKHIAASGSYIFEGYLNIIEYTIAATENLTFTKTAMTDDQQHNGSFDVKGAFTSSGAAVFNSTVTVGDTLQNGFDASSRIVSLTEATVVTAALHGNGKLVTLDLLAGFDTTLPAATGGGDTFHFIVGTVNTTNDYGILANGTDIFKGSVVMIDTDTVADSASGFATGATTDKIEINGTSKGGLRIGDTITFIDGASGVWYVQGTLTGSGAIATPFAAT